MARDRGVLLRPLGDVVVVMPPLAIDLNLLDRLGDVLYTSVSARQLVSRWTTCSLRRRRPVPGKTVVTAALARTLREQGTVWGLGAVATGRSGSTAAADEDMRILAEAAGDPYYAGERRGGFRLRRRRGRGRNRRHLSAAARIGRRRVRRLRRGAVRRREKGGSTLPVDGAARPWPTLRRNGGCGCWWRSAGRWRRSIIRRRPSSCAGARSRVAGGRPVRRRR